MLDEVLRIFGDRDILDTDTFRDLADEYKAQSGRLVGVWNTQFVEAVYGELLAALRDGQSVREVVPRLQMHLDHYASAHGVEIFSGTRWSPAYADVVFRTNTQAGYAGGRYSEQFTPGAIGQTPYWMYSAIGDDRTRPQHLALDGKVFRKDDPASRYYLPPMGFNCLPASALVSGRFSGAFKAWYSGPMVELTTRRGNRLTVTANHPVLTPRGFVRANDIKEGDYLVCHGGRVEGRLDPGRCHESVAGVLPPGERLFLSARDHVQDRPAQIGELFETFKLMNLLSRSPARPDDLYGDAAFGDGQVEVVLLDRELPGHRNPASRQGGKNLRLAFVDKPEAFVTGLRALAHGLKRGLSPQGSLPCSAALALDGGPASFDAHPFQGFCLPTPTHRHPGFLDGASETTPRNPGLVTQLFQRLAKFVASSQLQNLGDRSSPCLSGGAGNHGNGPLSNPALPKDLDYPSRCDAEFLLDSHDGRTSEVIADDVVLVNRFSFSGHVYDLQSPYGWILAEGIYISNCRCSTIMLSEQDLKDGGYRVTDGGAIPGLPMLDAHGNPMLDKDGAPLSVGLPPKGWQSDRVDSLVPGTLRGSPRPTSTSGTP